MSKMTYRKIEEKPAVTINKKKRDLQFIGISPTGEAVFCTNTLSVEDLISLGTQSYNYNDAYSKRKNAESLATKEYLKNCVRLVNALNSVGQKLELSCYYQLKRRVDNLQNLYSFGTKSAYDNESSKVYDLIQEFEKTKVFGVSTSAHAQSLKNSQDYYDRSAENYTWNE